MTCINTMTDNPVPCGSLKDLKGPKAIAGCSLLDHLLTLARIDMRLIEYASFLENSSFLDPKERRVLSCKDKVTSACADFASKASPAVYWLLQPLCGDRPLQAVEQQWSACLALLTVFVPIFVFLVGSSQRCRRVLRCCCHLFPYNP